MRVKNLVLDATGFPEEQALELWVQAFQWLHHPAPLRVPGRKFSSNATTWMIDDLIFAHARLNAQTFSTEPQDFALPHRKKYICCWYFSKGSAHVLQDGSIFQIERERLYISDNARPYRAISCDADVMVAIIPHHAVGYDPLVHPAHFEVSQATELGRELLNGMLNIFRKAPSMTQMEVHQAAEKYKENFRLALQSPGAVDKSLMVSRDPIRAYVKDHMFEPDLTIEHLMARFELPRSAIYEALNIPSGLPAYIADCRLDYAFRSLAFGDQTSHRIQDVAEYCGFTSSEDFESAFREKFGMPSEVVLGVLHAPSLLPEKTRELSLWETWHGL